MVGSDSAKGQPTFRHRSIAEIDESEFVSTLLSSRHWRSSLFAIRGIPSDTRFRTEVPLSRLHPDLRGDVDILVVPKVDASKAIAIEVKRIKFGLAAVRSGTPNKLHEFAKGIKQANRLAAAGFSQVYLWIFVVVDTREQNAGRYTYDGLSPELRAQVDQTVRPAGLCSRAGLIRHEFVQPMDTWPLGVGFYGGHLERIAEPVAQSATLTVAIEDFLAASADIDLAEPEDWDPNE